MQRGSAGIAIVRHSSFSPSNKWTLPAGSSPMPTMRLIASKAAKLPTVAGQRAEHPELGAIVAILGVERVADEAAVAGPGAEQPDLALELHRRRRQQRNAELNAGVADREPSGEIVAAVNHQIVAGEQLVGIVRHRSVAGPASVDEAVEPMHELRRQLGLGLARHPLRGTAAGGEDSRARPHHRR